ncbi:phosphate ABC transporter ATP-binding protein [Methanonatronarchaeum sp. AMET-Sl]|uniref:amino acid ABC transporter ATP-binding protein n=1 Tax=Methanonatronarchaeum sp. AMET-Sl TaxID=3037654 RepID=UPI00244E4AE5|nr:phosphate ABC transporter ATP-binding protein [Methanonatronarchaeum sp. AMET-Sl]WGI17813.1 phosphate ABC transporter ATP-binding protein [Methanonatronarchaeum sp. AMET-Sl]
MASLKTIEKTKNLETETTKKIALTGVEFGFKNKNNSVLKDITLDLRHSEVLAIIGPSGTGKTTLLRLLSLFYKPDKGNILFNDNDIWGLPKKQQLLMRRKIGMVFQQPNLFNASVHQNVKYGLKVRRRWRDRLKNHIKGLINKKIDQNVLKKLETVGLENYINKNVKTLSGGEAQRVAFARALAIEPEYLLLDEPTSDLDPRNTAIIEDAIHKARSKGIGIAVATHDMNQAERIADRVAVIINGQILEVGKTEKIFNNPKNPKTKRFIEGKLVY